MKTKKNSYGCTRCSELCSTCAGGGDSIPESTQPTSVSAFHGENHFVTAFLNCLRNEGTPVREHIGSLPAGSSPQKNSPLTHTHIYIHTHTHIYTHIHIHTCTYTHLHTHTYTHIHTFTHTYTYTCTHTCIYIHTHH
jgi:hypothetical protein